MIGSHTMLDCQNFQTSGLSDNKGTYMNRSYIGVTYVFTSINPKIYLQLRQIQKPRPVTNTSIADNTLILCGKNM